MAKPGETGVKRLISATGYSLHGLRACWRMEAAFRQEVLACFILIPLGLFLGAGGLEKAILVGSCLLVIMIEVINSSIEAVVDRIGHEHHDLSGLAKDLGSLAVLLSLVNWAVMWVLVLLF